MDGLRIRIRVKDAFDAKLTERIKLFRSIFSLSHSFIPLCWRHHQSAGSLRLKQTFSHANSTKRRTTSTSIESSSDRSDIQRPTCSDAAAQNCTLDHRTLSPRVVGSPLHAQNGRH